MLEYFTSAFLGSTKSRNAHFKSIKKYPSIEQGIQNLINLCPSNNLNDPEQPIFLLSAGWRSGSTLLQRLIISNSQVMLWGEPYDECGIIQAMANTNLAFRKGWPPADYFYNLSPLDQLSDKWIANLFPSVADLRISHRAFFDNLFALPAKRAGAKQWGIKEVRLNTDHCAYLRWIYPNAKFIFLYRNPLDAFHSYCQYGSNWYDIYPDKPILTPIAFGRHWKSLMESFLRDSNKLDALMICYEDLISGHKSIDALENYLNISIDRNLLNNKIGSSKQTNKTINVNYLQKWLLKRAVSPTAKSLGYTW